jgi:hypothetical protein
MHCLSQEGKVEKETSSNRTIWIILGVILVLACCCVLATAIAFLVVDRTVGLRAPDFTLGRVSDTSERTFDIGAQPLLRIDEFAGAINITAGDPGVIHVVATRRAPSRGELENIRIEYTELDNGLHIVTSLSNARLSNRSVDLDIEVPADAHVVVASGAGQVIVNGVAGELDLHTGAGEVIATGAMGGGRLGTGAGTVRYEGEPTGSLNLNTGVGEIVIVLPYDANVDLDLSTAIGDVDVSAFDVVGDLSLRDVRGTIGSGGPTIEAHTGAGSIRVVVLR